MKWILASSALTGIKEYHLVEDDQLLLVLKYSFDLQSIRIINEEERLVFFMENSGGFTNRIIFKNPYGVDIGKFSFNSRTQSGHVEINAITLHYTIVEGNGPKVVIHKRNVQQPLAVCHLPFFSYKPAAQYEQACFLLSLCWYAAVKTSVKNEQSL
jgi:hypothetical protein